MKFKSANMPLLYQGSQSPTSLYQVSLQTSGDCISLQKSTEILENPWFTYANMVTLLKALENDNSIDKKLDVEGTVIKVYRKVSHDQSG